MSGVLSKEHDKMANQASQTAGIASSIHTFHRMDVFPRCASYAKKKKHWHQKCLVERTLTSAQLAALYIFRIVPNLIMYMLPNNRLMSAEIRDNIAVVLAIGSDAAASIWSIVRMALKSVRK
jgi:hypothetical protein